MFFSFTTFRVAMFSSFFGFLVGEKNAYGLGFRGLAFRVYALDKQASGGYKNNNGQTSIGVSGLDCMPRV